MFSYSGKRFPFTIELNVQSRLVQLLSGESGVGKSFYADMLRHCLNASGVSNLLVDYNNYKTVNTAESIETTGLLVLDNSEIYESLAYRLILSCKGTVLIIGRHYPRWLDTEPKILRYDFGNKILRVWEE